LLKMTATPESPITAPATPFQWSRSNLKETVIIRTMIGIEA
jgi:hypothetical protein